MLVRDFLCRYVRVARLEALVAHAGYCGPAATRAVVFTRRHVRHVASAKPECSSDPRPVRPQKAKLVQLSPNVLSHATPLLSVHACPVVACCQNFEQTSSAVLSGTGSSLLASVLACLLRTSDWLAPAFVSRVNRSGLACAFRCRFSKRGSWR